jgi:hypothetical protein
MAITPTAMLSAAEMTSDVSTAHQNPGACFLTSLFVNSFLRFHMAIWLLVSAMSVDESIREYGW